MGFSVSGKRLQFANLKMAIEIVSCPIFLHGDFPVSYVNVYQRVQVGL